MIDVQAADAPGLFAAPSGVSFGLVRTGPRRTSARRAERRRRRAAGRWTVSSPGLDAPATVDVPAGGTQTLALTLAVPPGASVGNRSGNVVLSSGTHTVHLRWWGYVERPRLAKEHSRHLAPGRWIKGDTREGSKRVEHYRWPAGPAGSGLPRIYPGREQLWSFIVPHGARNAGIEAEGIGRAADPARPRREPPGGRARAARERQSLPRVLRSLRARERTARPGRGAATSSSSRRGPATSRAPTGCASGSTTARRRRSPRFPT